MGSNAEAGVVDQGGDTFCERFRGAIAQFNSIHNYRRIGTLLYTDKKQEVAGESSERQDEGKKCCVANEDWQGSRSFKFGGDEWIKMSPMSGDPTSSTISPVDNRMMRYRMMDNHED